MKFLKIKRMWLIIAVIGLLIFLYVAGALTPLENIIHSSFQPLQKRLYSLGTEIKTKYNEQTGKENLFNKIDSLEIKLRQLTAENAKLKILEEENKVLREQLNFLSENQYHYVMANIISAPGDSSFTWVIDKGGHDGLKEGLVAVDGQGAVVGKVVSVRDDIAEVRLITDSACQLAAALPGKNQTIGIARGELGLTVNMDFIPQSTIINVNDLIVTSGLERDIPAGLVIGQVTQVERENNELWQRAVAEPLADLDNILLISVILP